MNLLQAEESKPDIEVTTGPVDSQPTSDKPPKFHSWANVAAGGGSTAVAVVPPMSAAGSVPKQVSVLCYVFIRPATINR